jgi:hypothetical protein
MSDTSGDKTKTSLKSVLAVVIFTLLFVLLVIGNRWTLIEKYIDRHTSHEKVSVMRYFGEWSFGEYRDCTSSNVRILDGKPELNCASWPLLGYASDNSVPKARSSDSDTDRKFKVNFSGDLTYDGDRAETAVHYWVCHRNKGEPNFSCEATSGDPQTSATPVEPPLNDNEIENLRKRNACEERFYAKMIHEVDGMSIGHACKKNPDRMP